MVSMRPTPSPLDLILHLYTSHNASGIRSQTGFQISATGLTPKFLLGMAQSRPVVPNGGINARDMDMRRDWREPVCLP